MTKNHKIWTLSLSFLTGLSFTGNLLAENTNTLKKTSTSSVEIGTLYTTKDSVKFGDYLGLEKKGLHAIANVNLSKRSSHETQTGDQESSAPVYTYWNLKGSNLGLTGRDALFEYGKQGSYKIWLGYDQLQNFQTQNAKTIFSGVGETYLSLPTVWTPSTTTAGMTALNSNLKSLDVEHERRNYTLGFIKQLFKGWEASARYQREFKNGTQLLGGAIGTNGGNPRSVIIPAPIDTLTQQLNARINYTATKVQFQADYDLSIFDNRKTSLTWENPFSRVTTSGGWAAAAGYAAGGKGRLALPPDNRSHQLTLMGGYNPKETLRFTSLFSFGRKTQNDTFLPFTINALTTNPLPRDSLGGKINTTLFDFRVDSKPSAPAHWAFDYRFENRHNLTPQALYIYNAGDAQDAQGIATNKARINLPYSTKQHQGKLKGGYYILSRTELLGSYTYDRWQRDFSEVKRTQENIFKLELRQHASEQFDGGIYVSWAKRKGSAYDGSIPYFAGHSPEFTSTQGADGQFDNHPLTRKYYLANKKTGQLGLAMTYTPNDIWTLQLNSDASKDDYFASEMGLRDSNQYQTTLEANFTPCKLFTSHAFYTHEFYSSKLNSRSYTDLATSNDPNRNWSAKDRDGIHTFGMGAEFTGIKDRYDLGANYLYSASQEKINVLVGSALTASTSGLPKSTSKLHSLELYGRYKLRSNLQAKLRYLYERFRSRNFAYDDINPDTIAFVLGTGEESKHYAVSLFGLSFDYSF